jgi:hypothetical protein
LLYQLKKILTRSRKYAKARVLCVMEGSPRAY